MENSGQKETYVGGIRKDIEGEMRTYLSGEVKDGARILSVGCGFAYESKPLLDIFPNAIYRGIDINEDNLMGARVSNPEIPVGSFEVGDATKQEVFGNIPWDIILLRNPQVLGSMGAYLDKGHLPEEVYGKWGDIFTNSIHALKEDGGVLFVTVDSLEERKLVVDFLNQDKNMQIIVDRENEHKIAKATFSDIFIILAKKN